MSRDSASYGSLFATTYDAGADPFRTHGVGSSVGNSGSTGSWAQSDQRYGENFDSAFRTHVRGKDGRASPPASQQSNSPVGFLEVRVLRAAGLRDTSGALGSSLYTSATVGRQVKKSAAASGHVDVAWSPETFQFTLDGRSRQLRLEVFGKSTFGKDDPVGWASVDILSVPPEWTLFREKLRGYDLGTLYFQARLQLRSGHNTPLSTASSQRVPGSQSSRVSGKGTLRSRGRAMSSSSSGSSSDGGHLGQKGKGETKGKGQQVASSGPRTARDAFHRIEQCQQDVEVLEILRQTAQECYEESLAADEEDREARAQGRLRGYVMVRIMKASGLSRGDLYVTIRLGGREYRTEVKSQVKDPVWNSKDYVFTVDTKKPEDGTLELEVWNHISFEDEELLGTLDVDVFAVAQRSRPNKAKEFLNSYQSTDGELEYEVRFLHDESVVADQSVADVLLVQVQELRPPDLSEVGGKPVHVEVSCCGNEVQVQPKAAASQMTWDPISIPAKQAQLTEPGAKISVVSEGRVLAVRHEPISDLVNQKHQQRKCSFHNGWQAVLGLQWIHSRTDLLKIHVRELDRRLQGARGRLLSAEERVQSFVPADVWTPGVHRRVQC